MSPDNTELLKNAYGETAANQTQPDCCGQGSCGSCSPEADELAVPASTASDASCQSGLSCGNPVDFAGIQQGETVLDLGCGAGQDVFLAASRVGPGGKVIGVDFSAEMLSLARDNEAGFAEDSGLHVTEFREGNIEDLPLFDRTVDVVISNCVVNLAGDRNRVFSEAFRVLRPGGRIVLSDLVIEDDLQKAELAQREDAGRVYASACSCEDYLAVAQAAGFQDVRILNLQRYNAGQCCDDPVTSGIQDVMLRLASSLTMTAVRPA